MKDEAITICTRCQHHRHYVQNPAAPTVWYNHFCAARERPLGIDPVTGAQGYFCQNDLGRTIFADRPYAHCRDINDGHCPDYSPA